MKQHSKWFAAVLAVASGLVMVNSAQAQAITGTPYLSNIPAVGPSYSGLWATPLATITSTATGLEFNAPGGTGSVCPNFLPPPFGAPHTPHTHARCRPALPLRLPPPGHSHRPLPRTTRSGSSPTHHRVERRKTRGYRTKT